MVVLAFIIIGCAVWLFIYYGGSYKSEKEKDNVRELIDEDARIPEDIEIKDGVTIDKKTGEPTVNPKFDSLLKQYPKFVGWLTIGGTKVDYPVVQTPEDEEYYLRRDINGKDDKAGTLFVDTDSDLKRPSTNIIIYGHNMHAGTMFHDILKYADEDFYKEHKYITFDSIFRRGTYEVIAAFYTKIGYEDSGDFKYYRFFDAATVSEFDDYVNNCKKLTSYETGEASFGDELLTLSTCSYHTDNGRYVVVAKKIDKE